MARCCCGVQCGLEGGWGTARRPAHPDGCGRRSAGRAVGTAAASALPAASSAARTTSASAALAAAKWSLKPSTTCNPIQSRPMLQEAQAGISDTFEIRHGTLDPLEILLFNMQNASKNKLHSNLFQEVLAVS